jgi:hypothetical protein
MSPRRKEQGKREHRTLIRRNVPASLKYNGKKEDFKGLGAGGSRL